MTLDAANKMVPFLPRTILHHGAGPVGSDCVFYIVIDISLMCFSLPLSTGSVKNKHK